MNSIEISGLKIAFGGTPVLENINCKVREGSVHGFLGPNGAGKTTTIKIILGIYRADAGDVRLFGKPICFSNMQPFLKNISYLPQDPVFPEQYSGIEVMELVANLYGIPAAERVPRIKELLKRFDLLSAGTRQVRNYSRGMKQRLGLATVWLPRPKLMILDEPVSALDPEGRHEVLEQIKEIKGHSTVFFSSHILSDVERVSDQVTIIGRGIVLLEDSMDNIRGKYVSSAFLLKVPIETVNRAKEILAEIPGIISITGEDNNIVLQADNNSINDTGKKALMSILEADIPVIRFSLQEATLEDVFLQLINGGTSNAANVNT
ncbi:MAG: ABC transporter ATP-binding protein [Bacillota bacterium]